MTFSIDGKQVHSEYVEGDGNYNYSHGDNIARVEVTAGDHAPARVLPDLANIRIRSRSINADGRQELFVDYMRILGPYNPSTPLPAGYKKIFICVPSIGQATACAKQIVTNLITRAYRRPATPEEVQKLVEIVERGAKARFRRAGRSRWRSRRCSCRRISCSASSGIARCDGCDGGRLRTAAAYHAERLRAGVAALLFSVEQHAGRGAVPAGGREAAARPAVLDAQVQRMLQDPKVVGARRRTSASSG